MYRKIRLSEKLVLTCLGIILVFMIVQDLVPLGSLNDLHAIANVHSINEVLITTLIGVLQILLLMGLVIIYMGKRYPVWIKLWLIIHQSSIFVGVLFAWWIPYFFGYGAEKRVEKYNQMFGNTHSFLPEMHGIVPNTLHIIFHLTLLISIILSVYISFTNSRHKGKYHSTFTKYTR